MNTTGTRTQRAGSLIGSCSMTFMKQRRKPDVLDKIRTGKFAEGAKGPFSSDIQIRNA
jgi:hypothetical protein